MIIDRELPVNITWCIFLVSTKRTTICYVQEFRGRFLAQKPSLLPHSLWKCLCQAQRVSGHVFVCYGYEFYLCFYDFPVSFQNCTDWNFFFFFFVLLDIDKEVLVILEDKLRVNSKYELKVSVNRLGEEEKEDITISLYTKVSPYGGSCTVSNRSGKINLMEHFFKLFGFPIFRFCVYLVKVIPETRCAH